MTALLDSKDKQFASSLQRILSQGKLNFNQHSKSTILLGLAKGMYVHY